MLTRIRCQTADLLGLWALPWLAAHLPASGSALMLDRAARWRVWHRMPESGAIDALARAFPNHWPEILQRWRYTVLVEASAAFALKHDRTRRLTVSGKWPKGRFLPVTMHYGSGLHALWHMRDSGLNPRLVYRPIPADSLSGRPVMVRYYAARARLVDALCNQRPIATGGAYTEIVRALRNGDGHPVLVVDTPAATTPDSPSMRIGACRISFSTGWLRAAREADVPVVPFRVEIGRNSPTPKLIIGEPIAADQAQAVYPEFERVLARDPGQWLLWHAVSPLLHDDGPVETSPETARQSPQPGP